MVILRKNKKNEQHQITIPKDIVVYKKWKENENLEFVEIDGNVVIRKTGKKLC